MKILGRVTAIVLFGLVVQACGVDAGGGFGATPGGVQDMQAARGLLANGVVPNPEAFVAEGLLSEFDLPINGDECTDTLCLDAAMGIAPDENGISSGWVQIGLSSDVDPDTFQRGSIATVYCIDTSGSMGGGTSPGTPGSVSVDLMNSITAQLDAGDEVAIVTYGSSAVTRLEFTPGNDPVVAATFNNLPWGGGTAMMTGLVKAYNVAAQYSGNAEQVRVMLFTDEQPNIGNTNPGSFRDVVESNGFQGVGLTIFGMGLGLDSELFSFMSDVRGANAYSLSAHDQVTPFIENNWPWFVSPIANNLTIASTTTGVDFVKGYGFPGSGNTVEETMTVETVFLSQNRGALVLKFHADSPAGFVTGAGASIAINYEEIDGSPRSKVLDVNYDGTPLDGNGYYMPELSVHKSMALVTLVEGMKNAATAYTAFTPFSPYDPEANPESTPANDAVQALAVSILEGVLARYNVDVQIINEPEYQTEYNTWLQMLTLMEAGAQQGDLYGYVY